MSIFAMAMIAVLEELPCGEWKRDKSKQVRVRLFRVFSNPKYRSVQRFDVLLDCIDLIPVQTTVVRTLCQFFFYLDDDNPRK